MLTLIDKTTTIERIQSVYRLRHKVFKGRLDWAVNSIDDMEFDEFDHDRTCYLVKYSGQGDALGCARIMPTEGPNMLRDIFPFLMDNPVPSASDLWEISRFAVDTQQIMTNGYLSSLTTELLIGLAIIGERMNLRGYIAVVDLRMERIVRRTAWPIRRIGQPKRVGSTTAVAIELPTNRSVIQRMMEKNTLTSIEFAPLPMLENRNYLGTMQCI